jgi:CBS domain-containing protein
MKRRLVVALALVGLLTAVLISRAGAASQTTSDVTLITDPTVVVGSSTLIRTANRVTFTLQTTRLPAGHAMTVWWMVVNPDESMSVLYATGHVIDRSGAAVFGGSLREGDTKGILSLPGLSTQGLLDAEGADVSLVVRDHGPAKRGIVHQQIRTFDVCNPTCTDLQMSVHLAG